MRSNSALLGARGHDRPWHGLIILFGILAQSAAAHAQLIVRKEQKLAGLTVDVYSIASDGAPADGIRVGGLLPDMFEATIDVVPGSYEIRATYVVRPPESSASTEAQLVSLPLDISVSPDTARSSNGAVVVGANATPIIVDVALAEMPRWTFGTAPIAARYQHACAPAKVGPTDWSVGERCANLAYIQSQAWAAERDALQRGCDNGANSEVCAAIAVKEQIWARARQSILERGCRFGSPRACAAWDGAAQVELDRECRAGKDSSWVACLRLFAREERPLFYESRYEPEITSARSEPPDNGDSVRVAIGISGWRSPDRENPIVVLPFALRTTLLGHTPVGRLGITATFAPAIQNIPVLVRGSNGVADHYQLLGLQAELGPSWSPFSFIRLDGSAFYEATVNQSASTAGLKAELALIVGDHALSALIAFARVPNLTREVNGATRSSIGGADLTFYGLSYFYTVREE
jgi:hypothetical protein